MLSIKFSLFVSLSKTGEKNEKAKNFRPNGGVQITNGKLVPLQCLSLGTLALKLGINRSKTQMNLRPNGIVSVAKETIVFAVFLWWHPSP